MGERRKYVSILTQMAAKVIAFVSNGSLNKFNGKDQGR